MPVVSMKALLETGVHFGHRSRKWNPKMKPFIFTERNGIHIIDLQQTLTQLEKAYQFIVDTVADGGEIMFVGTKRQAQETIEREARRCGMPYVNQRWLGGTLTNWRTIRERIQTLKDLEQRRDSGEFDLLTKKEGLILQRKIDKLQFQLAGIRDMDGLPQALFVVDVKREYNAVHEANILEIPVVALLDTNCDPDNVDYVIPANDDAIRSIKLLAGKVADAVLEGKNIRKDGDEGVLTEEDYEDYMDFSDYDFDEEEEEDEDEEAYFGESTLAHLRSGDLSFGEDDYDDEDE
jgi:small subunit ribosomal protein S2